MNELLTVFTGVTLVALVYDLANTTKYLFNLDLPDSRNALVTKVTVWVLAFAVLILGAQADVAEGIVLLNNTPLADLDVPSLVLIALSFGSSAALTRDFLKSRDDTQTIQTPQLTRMDRKLPPGVE